MKLRRLNRTPFHAILWLLLLSTSRSYSQTTNISGVVNSYHKVIDIVPAKACVLVSSTAGLSPNAKVLLVQMKGIDINTSNSAAFGDVNSLNQAGNYEVATICAIRGDSVFFVNTILNSYSPSQSVQLVRFGEYVSANVTGTISAIPWNAAAGTGGVIAIFAEQDLIMNQDITAQGVGYRGGDYVLSSGDCANFSGAATDYFYDASLTGPQNGAYKGEGAVILPISLSGGRGPAGNGGGGGNNHNNAGGGGANLTAGGRGGGNSSSSGCRTTLRGEAGKFLNNGSGTKIFFGGGGGAGHNNNGSLPTGGGNGGGIIFIHATNIIGNGRMINAMGQDGYNSIGDASGGGGAGGTIIMDVANYSGSLTIKVDGGHGGNTDDGLNIKSCFGGGGGGSGGVVYFSSTSPAATITNTGGGAGNETSRDPACNAPQPALAGTVGMMAIGYAYRTSSTLAGYCSTILPVRLSMFKAVRNGSIINLRWQLPNAESAQSFIVEKMTANRDWTSIQSVSAQAAQTDYTAEDRNPVPGYNYYRVKVLQQNGSIFYSAVRQVFTGNEGGTLAVYPNPVIDNVIIRGEITGPATIHLFDASGKMVMQKKIILNSITQISIPRLSAGVYSLRINERAYKIIVK